MSVHYKKTIDHAEIKKWAEKHQAIPEIIDDGTDNQSAVGIRLDFPGDGDEAFFAEGKMPKKISWDEFFKIFDDEELVFFYDTDPQETDDLSNAYRFDTRQTTA